MMLCSTAMHVRAAARREMVIPCPTASCRGPTPTSLREEPSPVTALATIATSSAA